MNKLCKIEKGSQSSLSLLSAKFIHIYMRGRVESFVHLCKSRRGLQHQRRLRTMLQKLSKCEVMAWLCWNLIILLPLSFYVKSHFSKFKQSKNVIFGNFRDSELRIFGLGHENQNSEALKLQKMIFLDRLNSPKFDFTYNLNFWVAVKRSNSTKSSLNFTFWKFLEHSATTKVAFIARWGDMSYLTSKLGAILLECFCFHQRRDFIFFKVLPNLPSALSSSLCPLYLEVILLTFISFPSFLLLLLLQTFFQILEM